MSSDTTETAAAVLTTSMWLTLSRMRTSIFAVGERRTVSSYFPENISSSFAPAISVSGRPVLSERGEVGCGGESHDRGRLQ